MTQELVALYPSAKDAPDYSPDGWRVFPSTWSRDLPAILALAVMRDAAGYLSWLLVPQSELERDDLAGYLGALAEAKARTGA